MTRDLVVPVLTDAILTLPDPSKADAMIDSLTKADIKLTKTIEGLIRSRVGQVGSMTIQTEPVVVESMSAAELDSQDRRITNHIKARAKAELGRLTSAKAILNAVQSGVGSIVFTLIISVTKNCPLKPSSSLISFGSVL